MLVQSLHELLGCNRYMDMPTGSGSLLSLSTGHLGCRQNPVDMPLGCQQVFLES